MKGKLIVISGLSGAGKGTIASELVKRFDNFVLSISATTRDKRASEIDGVHYFFVDKNEFMKMIENDALLEYAKYVDNYYGTPKKFVFDKLNNGINVILEIEMQGALQIKKIFNEAVLIFFTLKDADTQFERLVKRGREKKEQVIERLNQAIIDATYAKNYDYIIVNDELEKTIDDVISIINGSYDNKDYDNNLNILNNLIKQIKEKNYV